LRKASLNPTAESSACAENLRRGEKRPSRGETIVPVGGDTAGKNKVREGKGRGLKPKRGTTATVNAPRERDEPPKGGGGVDGGIRESLNGRTRFKANAWAGGSATVQIPKGIEVGILVGFRGGTTRRRVVSLGGIRHQVDFCYQKIVNLGSYPHLSSARSWLPL